MKKQAEMDRENRNAVRRVMGLVPWTTLTIAARVALRYKVKAEIADAHHRGYLDGDAAQMEMRIRDEMERKAKR